MFLKSQNLVIVDLETTGGSFDFHRVTEIGAVKVREGEVVATFHSLIDPERPIPPSITQLTGITDEMVAGAPVFGAVADELYDFLEGSIFVAHNARFDYGFIRHEFERVGRKFSSKILCSARLSRLLFPRVRHHNLSAIIERNGIKIDNRHRALDDAKAVWEYLKIIGETVPVDKQEKAIAQIVKKPSLPVKLITKIEDIPETAGVYFFFDEHETPLYIGKSRNLRSRVVSHFTDTLHSDKEMKLAQQVVRVECVQTEGELAALLLESYYIKKHLPVYNRRSRRTWHLTALKIDVHEDYHRLYLETLPTIKIEDLADIVTVFRTKGDGEKFLDSMAREFRLCRPFLGLEKKQGQTGCFYFEIEQCAGACIQKEKAAAYNLRLQTVVSKYRDIRWPFNGPIVIEEADSEKRKGEVIVVDHWVIQEAFRYQEEERRPLLELDYVFDLDAFRILYGYMERNSKLKFKVLPPAERVEM